MQSKNRFILCLMFNVLSTSFISIICFPVTGCLSQTAENLSDVKGVDTEKQKDNPYSWDFGEVKQGAVLTHDFVFKNESNSVLTIKDVNTSCGCTLSEIKKKVLQPNESTVIGVKFNSKGYSGPVTQFIYVNTDSLDKPIVRYIIKANVVK